MPDSEERRLRGLSIIALRIWSTIGAVLLIAGATLGIARIASVLAPFVMAAVIVFALNWPVKALAGLRVPRGLATGICFILGLAVLALAVVFIAPPVGHQLVELAKATPGLVTKAVALVEQLQARFNALSSHQWVADVIAPVTTALSKYALALGSSLVSAGSGMASGIFSLFLAMIVAFWTLKDLPQIRKEIDVLAGERYKKDIERLFGTIGEKAGGYLRGQTIASLVTGTLAWIGLSLLGVRYAAVLGILTAVLNFVPYIGPFTAGLAAAIIAVLDGSGLMALGAIAIIVAAQNVTDMFITPRVMAEQVDLHPTLVIFSLLLGGSLFGFWGMIFAIPVAATIKALFVYYYEAHTDRDLATEDGALFRSRPECEDQEP